ncbi:uncharacterized protein LOC133181208 [Saccostrea echinata]|uniref:uncharacterized protein LOC133181208 n=1 Tax=Saccostrea echinata TaxID=191078 RepID=UPI002A8387A9|nr:uncharacterized protein LOC133181208 [Saccostrea echinata]
MPITLPPKTVDVNRQQSGVGEKSLVYLRQSGSEILGVPYETDGKSVFHAEDGNKINNSGVEGTTFYKSGRTAYRYKDDGRKEYVTMSDSAFPVSYHQKTEIFESDQNKEKIPFYQDRSPEDLTSGRIYRKQTEWRTERATQDDTQPRVYKKWKVIEKTEA